MRKPHQPSGSEIILYQTEDGRTRLQVKLQENTVWLTQKQLAELFQKDVRTINEHIQNILAEGELNADSVIRNFRITAADGKNYDTKHFNLDAIIAVGYRVKSHTYTKTGLEQDVIVRENPLSSEAYGLNPATTELEAFTEFINPPTASLRDLPADGTTLEVDQEVAWGVVHLGRGKAFSMGGQDSPASVVKRYTTIQGRHFLLERVSLKDIQKSLSKLPDQAANAKRLPVLATKNPAMPQAPKLQAIAKPMKLALGAVPSQGYVLDYVTINADTTDLVLQGDTTYYVSGLVNVYGTTVLEGGAVVKNDYYAGLTFELPDVTLQAGNLYGGGRQFGGRNDI